MGVKAGDHLLVQQPFSGALIVTPLRDPEEGITADAVRTLGWAWGRADTLEVGRRFVLRELAEAVQCTVCRQQAARTEIVGGCVCDYCLAELANVVRLRMEPSQLEISLK